MIHYFVGKKLSVILWLVLSVLLINCTSAEKTPYRAKTLGAVKVSVFDGHTVSTKKYPNNAVFRLSDNCLVCIGLGEAKVEIDGGQGDVVVLKKTKPCVMLQTVKNKSFSKAFKRKIVQVFPTKPTGEGEIVGSHRGSGDTYKEPIYLNDKAYLVIESDKWITSPSRLPIVLKLISPEGEIVMQFESETMDFTSFILPREVLKDKEGYVIEISNQQKNQLMKSRFLLRKSKQK